MSKLLIKIGITSFFLLILSSFSFAEETLTFTTYYPSPYASYNELRAKRMAIGDNYIDSTTYTWEVTDGDGGEVDYLADLVVEGRVGIGTVIPTVPLHVAGAATGAVRIVDGNQALGYVLTSDANGVGKWQASSGGIVYTYYCYNSPRGTPVCTDSGGTQGYCPAGYTQKLALGAWGVCYYTVAGCYGDSYYYHFLPPNGSCGSTYPTTQLFGYAYVCSQ
ncbi:MAG: hypothetical protein WC723_03205 [Candidatus Omnitrophota bacterium]